MNERSLSLGCVIASLLWCLTFMFILAGTIVGITADEMRGSAVAMALMAHGLASSAGAATITIRNGLAHQNRLLEDAFRLGQDTKNLRRVGS